MKTILEEIIQTTKDSVNQIQHLIEGAISRGDKAEQILLIGRKSEADSQLLYLNCLLPKEKLMMENAYMHGERKQMYALSHLAGLANGIPLYLSFEEYYAKEFDKPYIEPLTD
jgi:hypothetical protein